jgi:hypothetical protein
MKAEENKLETQQEQLDIPVVSGSYITNVNKMNNRIIFLIEETERLNKLQKDHPDDNRIEYWKENVRGQLRAFKYVSENVE